MAPLTRELRDALIRVKKDPQLQPFVEYLHSELAHEHTAMTGLDAPMVYRAQGRAGYLSDLLRFIDGADQSVGSDKGILGRTPITAGLF